MLRIVQVAGKASKNSIVIHRIGEVFEIHVCIFHITQKINIRKKSKNAHRFSDLGASLFPDGLI